MKKKTISKDTLKELYLNKKLTTKEISEIFSCSRSPIERLLKLYKIPIRNHSERQEKYLRNKLFFHDEQNSYWAGFIAADGNIIKNIVRLELQYRDIIILDSLREQCGFNKNIEYNTKRNLKYCRFSISEKQWVNDLKRYWNITENKSLTLGPPNIIDIEKQLQYIIGIIDGDGCIFLRTQKYGKPIKPSISLTIVGSELLLLWIAEILFQLEDNNKYTTKKVICSSNSRAMRLSYEGIRAYNILKRLSDIKVPFKLERKWKKILEYEELIKENND